MAAPQPRPGAGARRETFDAAMGELAGSLARLATRRVTSCPTAAAWVPACAVPGRRSASARPTRRRRPGAEGAGRALDAEVRADTQALIRCTAGRQAQGEILTRLATHYEMRLRLDETQAALWAAR